jgi:hypothetical protein
MKHTSRSEMDRREFIKLGLTAGALLPIVGATFGAATARASEDKLVTEIAENGMLVESLQYVNESKTEGQSCSTCMLFTAGAGGRGKCQLFQQGVVSEKGWCASWSKKP